MDKLITLAFGVVIGGFMAVASVERWNHCERFNRMVSDQPAGYVVADWYCFKKENGARFCLSHKELKEIAE